MDFDLKSLVIYGEDFLGNALTTVMGVKEFRIAKALLEGQQEPLGELVPSQWGPVHLFDLCLWFGYIDTALALVSHGVKGCTLENRHLGALPDARHAAPDHFFSCACEGWNTCSCCCWGFPVENGVWMKDWDAPLRNVNAERIWMGGDAGFVLVRLALDAADAAREAARMPLVKGLLEVASCTETLSLVMSEELAARLLDIAILIGNVEAAANLAKTYQARPLRRWRGRELDYNKLSTISAALFAGADFQGLHTMALVPLSGDPWYQYFQGTQGPPDTMVPVPLLQQVALYFEQEQWQQLEQFFPTKNKWPTDEWHMELDTGWLEIIEPSNADDLDGWSHPQRYDSLCMQRIQNALRGGWNLKYVKTILREGNGHFAARLLDLAILCGQRDCAGTLASAGVELSLDCLDLLREVLRGEHPDHSRIALGLSSLALRSALECQSAASAAANASLERSFKLEGVQKGIALYQTLVKKFRPRGVPMALVRHILGFSMEAPKILDQLDLWEDVKGWMPSMSVSAHGFDKISPVHPEVKDQPGADVVEEPGTLPAELRSDSAEADVKSTDDLMTALQMSRDQVPVLNVDGVCVFRLTRMATSEHVARILLDATGPLAELHRRVLEAGCEVNPEWNPVRALFVPITEAQMAELQALSEHGYELNKTDHLLALQSDQDLITEALREICWKYRPRIAKVGPEAAVPGDVQMDQEDMDDDEPLLILESGIRTDSDLGFPTYHTSSAAW